MDDCSNSQEQQQNIFPVSTTTGISKRQISLTASLHAVHLPVCCQSMFPSVRVICTCSSRRPLTFLIKTLHTQGLVSLLPGPWPAPGKWLSSRQNYRNFPQRKIQGVNPATPAGSTQPCCRYPCSKEEASPPCSWVATQCQQLPVIIHGQARPAARARRQGLPRLHYPSLQPKLEGQTIDTQPQRRTLTPMSQTTRLLNKGQDPCGHGNLQPAFKINTVCC